MKFIGYILILLIGSNLLILKDNLPKNLPKHIEVEVVWGEIENSDLAFSFNSPDTMISHQVHLLYDKNKIPLLYYSDIVTPVCIDGLCKPVYVEMYWDLMGNYMGYGEYAEESLSKFDHEGFEKEDYEKLHDLLLDQNSILGRRKLTALYDIGQERKIPITFKGIEIDGVSGATKKQFKDEIIDGALYSCYALWHIANGNVKKRINQEFSNLYDDNIEAYFLNSSYDPYQNYALKMLPKSEFSSNINQIVNILLSGKTLTRSYGIKKMPKKLFANPLVVEKLFSDIEKLDFNARTLLIKRLEYSLPSAALALSEQVNHMSKNQLKSYLNIMEGNTSFRTEEISTSLHTFSKESKYPYSYLITDYLNNIDK